MYVYIPVNGRKEKHERHEEREKDKGGKITDDRKTADKLENIGKGTEASERKYRWRRRSTRLQRAARGRV